MAAHESKLESYDKEIKQLQKALNKSDKYIAELELQHRRHQNGAGGHSCKENSMPNQISAALSVSETNEQLTNGK